jgi:hypothetical protein
MRMTCPWYCMKYNADLVNCCIGTNIHLNFQQRESDHRTHWGFRLFEDFICTSYFMLILVHMTLHIIYLGVYSICAFSQHLLQLYSFLSFNDVDTVMCKCNINSSSLAGRLGPFPLSCTISLFCVDRLISCNLIIFPKCQFTYIKMSSVL